MEKCGERGEGVDPVILGIFVFIIVLSRVVLRLLDYDWLAVTRSVVSIEL